MMMQSLRDPHVDSSTDWLVVHDAAPNETSSTSSKTAASSSMHSPPVTQTRSQTRRAAECAGIGGEVNFGRGDGDDDVDDVSICWFLLEPRNRVLINQYGTVVASDGAVRDVALLQSPGSGTFTTTSSSSTRSNNRGRLLPSSLLVCIAASDGTFVQQVSPSSQTSLLFSCGEPTVSVVPVELPERQRRKLPRHQYSCVAAIREDGDVFIVDLTCAPNQIIHRVAGNTSWQKLTPSWVASSLSLVPGLGAQLHDAVTLERVVAVANSGSSSSSRACAGGGGRFACLREHFVQVWATASCSIVAEYWLDKHLTPTHCAMSRDGSFVAIARLPMEDEHGGGTGSLVADAQQSSHLFCGAVVDVYQVVPQSGVYDRPFKLVHRSVFHVPIADVRSVSIFSASTVIVAGPRRVCVGALRDSFITPNTRTQLLLDKALPHESTIVTPCFPTAPASAIFQMIHPSDLLDDAGCHVRIMDMGFVSRIDFMGLPSAALRRFCRLGAELCPELTHRHLQQQKQQQQGQGEIMDHDDAATATATAKAPSSHHHPTTTPEDQQQLLRLFNEAFRAHVDSDESASQACQLLIRALAGARMLGCTAPSPSSKHEHHHQSSLLAGMMNRADSSLLALSFLRAAMLPAFRSIEGFSNSSSRRDNHQQEPQQEDHPAGSNAVDVTFSLAARALHLEVEHIESALKKLQVNDFLSSNNNNNNVDSGSDSGAAGAVIIALAATGCSANRLLLHVADYCKELIALAVYDIGAEWFDPGAAEIVLEQKIIRRNSKGAVIAAHGGIDHNPDSCSQHQAMSSRLQMNDAVTVQAMFLSDVVRNRANNVVHCLTAVHAMLEIGAVDNGAIAHMIDRRGGARTLVPTYLRRTLVHFDDDNNDHHHHDDGSSSSFAVRKDSSRSSSRKTTATTATTRQLPKRALDALRPLCSAATNREIDAWGLVFAGKYDDALALVRDNILDFFLVDSGEPLNAITPRFVSKGEPPLAELSLALALVQRHPPGHRTTAREALVAALDRSVASREAGAADGVDKLRSMFREIWETLDGADAEACLRWLMHHTTLPAMEIAAECSVETMRPFLGGGALGNAAQHRSPHAAWWLFKHDAQDKAAAMLHAIVTYTQPLEIETRKFLAQCAVRCAPSDMARVVALQDHVLAQEALLRCLQTIIVVQKRSDGSNDAQRMMTMRLSSDAAAATTTDAAGAAGAAGAAAVGTNDNTNNSQMQRHSSYFPPDVEAEVQRFMVELESGSLVPLHVLQQWCGHHHRVPGVGACELRILKAMIQMPTAAATSSLLHPPAGSGASSGQQQQQQHPNAIMPGMEDEQQQQHQHQHQQHQQNNNAAALPAVARITNIAAWCGAFEAAVMQPLPTTPDTPPTPVMTRCVDTVASLGPTHGLSAPFLVSFVEAMESDQSSRCAVYSRIGVTAPIVIDAILQIAEVASHISSSSASASTSALLSEAFAGTRLSAAELFLRAARYFVDLPGEGDAMRMAFGRLDGRVKKLFATARTGSRMVSSTDRKHLEEANRVLSASESSLMDLDSAGRQRSFIF